MEKVILVDQWMPEKEDMIIISPQKGILQIPITNIGEPLIFNEFNLLRKRTYARKDFIKNLCQYINYFEKFYDTKGELLFTYRTIKFLIDYQKDFTIDDFKNHLKYNFITSKKFISLAGVMVNDNIIKKSEIDIIQKHIESLYIISIMYKLVIPLVDHYAFVNKIDDINEFTYDILKFIIENIDSDCYDKIRTNCELSLINHPDCLLSIDDLVQNILINIVPKYDFEHNILAFSKLAIEANIKYNIYIIEEKKKAGLL